MKEIDSKYFHKLYGIKKPRMVYQKKDFLDYSLMILISAAVIFLSYGQNHMISKFGIALCVLMAVVFPIRHGFEFRMPVILKRPQDVLYMLIYKIQNLKPAYIFAVSLLLLENYLIYLTPHLPHKVELMREIGFYLFYLHFISISLYRTVILIAHLFKKEHVRNVLMETAWRSLISRQPNITLEILHAYFTGLLTHMMLIAPWYIVITYFNFSIIFLPVIFLLNVITQLKFFKTFNEWFYRDHWLGHNSEFEFLYLHGTHHDVIPCSLIGVAGNGHLEGFMRHVLGYITPFLNPVVASVLYTFEIKRDMDFHQYIPGVFPKSTRELNELSQHSMHHFGRLEPYGVGLKFDQPQVPEKYKKSRIFPDEILNSIKLDEKLTGFEWDTPRYRKYLNLIDKYQNSPAADK